MTEVEYHRSLYDPPKAKGIFGVPPHVFIASVVVVCLFFGLLAFYFINAQFKLREVNSVSYTHLTLPTKRIV